MRRFLIGCGIVLMLFFLSLAGVMMSPIRTCSVEWVDRDNKQIQGLYNSCPSDLRTRSLGGQDYAQVETGVFRVERIVQRTSGDGLRPHVSELLLFIRDIDGPVELEKLEAFNHNNSFLSDGTNQFLNGHRLSLTPPLDFSKLRSVPPEKSIYSSQYLTDGTWVIFGNDVVQGAHPATFHEVEVLRDDGLALSSSSSEVLGVDHGAVFHGANRLEGADPATFSVIAYRSRTNAPPGVSTSEPDGRIAFDRRQGWRVEWTTIERFEPTKAQMKTLRADLQQARATAAVGW